MTIKDFEDLRIWQDARILSKDIYSITNTDKFKVDYRFCSQIRSAAGSIMDNIAEGFERDGSKEFLQFLYIAKASCAEVRSQLARAFDIEYIDEETYNQYRQRCIDEAQSILSKGLRNQRSKIQKITKPETIKTIETIRNPET